MVAEEKPCTVPWSLYMRPRQLETDGENVPKDAVPDGWAAKDIIAGIIVSINASVSAIVAAW